MRKALLLLLFFYIALSASPNVARAMTDVELQAIKHKEQLILDERKNQIIVKYKDNVPRTKAKLSAKDGVVEQTTVVPNVELLKIKDTVDANQLVKEFRKDTSVELVELNSVTHLNHDPTVVNDSYYDEQWWLESVNAPMTWQNITGSKAVVVAVIDSGLDLNHEDLKNKVAPGGYNFLLDNNDIYDINGHGTAVSGVIAAEANNYKGITGVTGPLNIKILPLQAGSADGSLYTSDVIRAIKYAIDQGADVINLSFGSDQYSSIENAAIQEAINAGIVVVAAVGNDGDGTYNYPASYENVIAVGATSPSGEVTNFSNHNDAVDLVAPGENVLTTQPQNFYAYMSGTSFSAPIVSGVVALMKAVNPSLTPQEITSILADNSVDKGRAGKDSYYGYGLVNTYDTLMELVGNEEPERDYTEIPEKVDVPVNKGWKVTFNLKLNPETVSTEQFYIKAANNSTVRSSVQLDSDEKSVFITPLEDYSYGQEYYLYIEDQIESETGAKLKKPVRMKFSITTESLTVNEPTQTYEVLAL